MAFDHRLRLRRRGDDGADGIKLYDSGILTGASASPTVSVDVTGKTALQLVVTNGGDNANHDHSDWADATLTCGT